jgi:arylsulfatase
LSPAEPRPPNVLLIMTDQHRADALGCMGNPVVLTPNIDRLASSGVVFDRAFTPCPVCMASRGAIHTGRLPRTIRVPSMGLLPPTEITLAESLKRSGYATGMFGKLHFTPQEYTLDSLGCDAPVISALPFLEAAGINSSAALAACDDPCKRDYGFDVAVGVEDFLWGHYLGWLRKLSPKHVPFHLSENWGKPQDRVKYGASPPSRRFYPDHLSDLFDSRMPADLHPSRFIVQKTQEFIRANRERPFFAHCSFVDPHHPFAAPEPFNRMYPADEMPIPSAAEPDSGFPRNLPAATLKQIRRMARFPPGLWQSCLSNYYGMISHIDSCVGDLLRELADMDLLEDTVIIFASDHGEYMGDHSLLYKGSLLFDSLIRVPLIIAWEGRIAGNRRRRKLAQTIDIYPTLMALLGLGCHSGVQGRDLSPMLSGGEESGHEAIFCELDQLPVSRDAGPSWAVRGDRWKLDYFPLSRTGMLFDLADDPGERYNLYDDPGYNSVRHELMMGLLDHYHLAKDPLPLRLSGA